MNNENLSEALPKEKRRSIVGKEEWCFLVLPFLYQSFCFISLTFVAIVFSVGDQDSFFGACDGSLVSQQQAISGYTCPVGRNDCMHRLPDLCSYGTGEQTCTDSTSENFGRQYTLSCPTECTEAR